MSIFDNDRNVFGIFAELKKLPFAVSRAKWMDSDFVVVTKVEPKGDYGVAYGFPVRNGEPNDHFVYDTRWKKEMIMPNAGSYQWRPIELSESQLEKLIEEFETKVSTRFEFGGLNLR